MPTHGSAPMAQRGGGVSTLFVAPAQGRDSDERYTPSWIFAGLGLTFDTDPASPGHGQGDCVPATTKLTVTDNGLECEWVGRVWLNPPFSNSSAWADKFRSHSNGVFLGPVANARWTLELMEASDLVWLCRDFAFTHPTHAGKRSSMPLFMAAMGPDCATALERLARSGVHHGVFFAPTVDAA